MNDKSIDCGTSASTTRCVKVTPVTNEFAVSGIMPLFNQRKTVTEAIESALNQTRSIEELIIVDDGSTDGSGDLVAEQYADNERVRLIRQENQGAGAARNTAIRAARYPLLAFLDADDRWLPCRIDKQVAFMEERPSCMISFTAAVLADEIHNLTLIEGTHIDKDTYLHKAFFREELLPASNGVMVRSEVFDEVGYFDERLRKCQDTDMWLRIMIRYGFEHIPEPLVWVRRGTQRTEPDMSKWFPYHHMYFKKHKHTFGRDLRGQMIWRSAYGSVLRGDAIWCLRQRRPTLALRLLAHAIWLWPFFNPKWVTKAVLEYSVGARAYSLIVSPFRFLIGRATRKEVSRACE